MKTIRFFFDYAEDPVWYKDGDDDTESPGLPPICSDNVELKAMMDELVKEYVGLYLQAFGCCGALYASRTLSSRTILYPFLGPEAVLELEVKDFPTICIIDSRGEVFKP